MNQQPEESAVETMKAIRMHAYGGPDVLVYEDAPRPTPRPGEVLIGIYAAGVNPMDWKVREGYHRQMINYSLPMIPGWDLSGVVETTGAGVVRFKKGDEVYSRPDITRDGAYAEYIVVKESEVASKPKSIDHIHAAAIPLAALTAWQALFDAAQLKPRQSVLIHAAAGGVGSFAVQFAKWKGAHVIGTASGRNQDFVRELGADEAVNYEKTRFEDVLHNIDVVLDTMGGEIQKRSWKVLKKGGILVSIVGQPPAEEAALHGVRNASIFGQPRAAQLVEIAKLVDSGKLKPAVEAVLPLSDARHAQQLSQTGHMRGKVVLRVV
jgi:NADPH:quinone reductase-like Zn-dependent oxidoreductase